LFISSITGHHNVAGNLNLADPGLTPLGITQCQQLAKEFPYHTSLDLIVTSPLRRTVETTLIGLKPAIEHGVLPILAEPLFQETGEFPCDIGSNPEVLKKELFSNETEKGWINWEDVEEGWNSKVSCEG